jgi:Mrp family chromosome partitioning ATPase
MKEMLAAVRHKYDYIILDGPPILAVNDARTLAALADIVLMVAHWGTTPKQAIRAALDFLAHDKSPVAGVILSMVDTRSSLAGGAAGGGYYSSRYTRYYQD